MRLLAPLLCALVVLAGCGGGGDEGRPIPSASANRMVTLIRLADRQSSQGTCSGAQDKVREARQVLDEEVPRSVDPDVRRGLADGLDRLAGLIQDECQRPEDTTTDTTATETTETTTTDTTATETTPTDTTETHPTQTETTPTDTGTTPTGTTPTDTTDTGTGGTPPPGVVDGGAGGVGE